MLGVPCVEIVLLSLLASALVTFMEWVLIYRTEGFADLTAEIDRTQKDRLSLSLPPVTTSLRTHGHGHIHVYMYVCVCVYPPPVSIHVKWHVHVPVANPPCVWCVG